jgi:aspartate/methionine/tyrosine aminotransferase
LIVDETYRDFLIDGPPHKLFAISSWRSNLVSLFSFSKSYCVPGHRLGAIVASPVLIQQIKTVLDCLQICPPRPLQQALTPLLQELRPFLRRTATAIASRHRLFRENLPSRWEIGSQGGYYAFVKHPFIGVSSFELCQRLAVQIGVVALPSAFFNEENPLHVDEESRWVRFSVANVDDEKVKKVCERLQEAEELFGWPLDE